MLRKILIGLAVVVVLFAIVIATRPATFHVERSTTVAAPAEVVFAQVNDFHAWRGWSPWEKLDPNMTRTHGGAPAGQGATYAWAGNKEVGEGRMTIQDSRAPSKIVVQLEFLKPFAATNRVTFDFAGGAAGTKVTWSMDGKNGFLAKAFHLFMDVDQMIGADFEKGLAAMKAQAENAAKRGAPAATAAK